jgi:hypothetical protein
MEETIVSKQTNSLRNAVIALTAAVSLSLAAMSVGRAEGGITSPPGNPYAAGRQSTYWSGGDRWMPRELKPIRGRYFHGDNGG